MFRKKNSTAGWDEDQDAFGSGYEYHQEETDAFQGMDFSAMNFSAPDVKEKKEPEYDAFMDFDFGGASAEEEEDDWSKPYQPPKRRKRRKNNTLQIAAVIGIILLGSIGCMFLGGQKTEQEAVPESTFPALYTISVQPTQAPQTTVPNYAPETTAPTAPPATTAPVQVGFDVNYYCRSLLNAQDQALYDRICVAIEKMESVPEIINVESDHIFEILDYVWLDHPEFFWIDSTGTASYIEENGVLTTELTINYCYSASERAEIERKMESYSQMALAGLEGCSQYEQVRAVYEYIINNSDYDYDYYDQNLCGIILHGRGVCAGYARTTQYLLQQLGIEAIYVRGTGKGESHGWNIINVEGDYYQLDTTWGDPIRENGEPPSLNYVYFCITSEEMYRDHQADGTLPLPDCTAVSCDFFIREGRYFAEYDRSAVLTLLKKDLINRRDLMMKFPSASLMQEFYYRLVEQDEIYNLMAESGIEGYSRDGIRYSMNKEHYILTIMFDYN